MTSAAPAVAVVVPTYRRPTQLVRLIDALSHQTLPFERWEVIVVDDCSGPDYAVTLDEIQSTFPGKLRVLSTGTNAGPAKARNIGWQATDAPLLAFCDDDVVPDPGWLAAGVAQLEADAELGLVQGATHAPAGTDVHALPEWWLFRVIEEPGPFFEGCNIFYRRAALEAVGGFDEVIAWWGEDTSTAWSVIENGWSRGWASDAVVVHDVEPRELRWWMRNGWLEKNVVALAARHPGYRREAFWRPWAFRKRDAAFAIGVGAIAASLVWRPALVGVLPYLWYGRPTMRRGQRVRRCVETALVDAARFAGQVNGAISNRVLVL